MSRWFLGETNRDGAPDFEAWKDYGFDIDNWTSTAKNGFHCKPVAGAKPADIRVDGNKGIDNSFGKNIIQGIFSTLIANPSEETTLLILQGQRTTLLDLGKVGGEANYSTSPSQWFQVTGKEGNPGLTPPPPEDWSGYAWRPLAGSIQGDGSSMEQFPAAYLAGNRWVSAVLPEVTLVLGLLGDMVLPIKRARISLDIQDRASGKMGNLGGVMPTDVFVAEFKKIASFLGSNFCGESSAKDGLVEAIRQASDILQDGTQDPEKECDAISIGLGFETRVSALGSAAPAESFTEGCPP